MEIEWNEFKLASILLLDFILFYFITSILLLNRIVMHDLVIVCSSVVVVVSCITENWEDPSSLPVLSLVLISTAKKLVQALVLCHLDYCNSLLYNMPDSHLGKLQLIQNSAARLITGTKKYSPITPVLQKLHWLPVKSRISFKILLLTFQCLHNMAPSYTRTVKQVHTCKKSQIITEKSSRMPSFRH